MSKWPVYSHNFLMTRCVHSYQWAITFQLQNGTTVRLRCFFYFNFIYFYYKEKSCWNNLTCSTVRTNKIRVIFQWDLDALYVLLQFLNVKEPLNFLSLIFMLAKWSISLLPIFHTVCLAGFKQNLCHTVTKTAGHVFHRKEHLEYLKGKETWNWTHLHWCRVQNIQFVTITFIVFKTWKFC